ncbi:PP2C family protein-serine/threonine phosphatase [Streptomyces sp. V4-01]|uniref:PP2C family protein-serine/threonine phosphatase n=1 Tax=Actinacidiphila polyblastidii TaxID=3110430 RepID=A0ABU7P3P7_9ACTN|nr:PP2C family protein-serine/threonine phosphatase [Streptomyces sp. V4-01]
MPSIPSQLSDTRSGMIPSALGAAPYPVLVVGDDGVVGLLNDTAAALLPAARVGSPLADGVPAWLAAAHARLDGDVPSEAARPSSPAAGAPGVAAGPIGERSYEAHPSVQNGGGVVWWLVDDTDRQLAHAALRVERERTAFLAGSSNTLLSSLNVDRCVSTTAQLAASHLADAALVVSPARGRRLPVVFCRSGGTPWSERFAVDPATVLGLDESLQGFPPVPSRWIDPATAPDWLIPEGFGEVGSIVVTPLPGHGVPAGALVLLRRAGRESFSQEEEVFARLFAARAGAAISAAHLYAEQASITEVLMRDLLPPVLHRVGGIDFAGGYRPSGDSERIGGDFYDVHPAPAQDDAQESLVVLGDVCGKGLEAAVLTGKIRNTLHALLPLAADHQRMLELLNGALLNAHSTRFATLVLASAARMRRGVRLRLTSAGHPAPLIVRAGGQVEEVGTRGTLVGALPTVRATTVETHLEPGETCLLFTDGVTEARGGPMGGALFGDERLQRVLAECAGMPAEAVVERVQMLASQWVGSGRHDDMAVIAITAPREPAAGAAPGHGQDTVGARRSWEAGSGADGARER